VLDIIFIFLFRNIVPDMFADHIGNLSVELVLAAAEVNILICFIRLINSRKSWVSEL